MAKQYPGYHMFVGQLGRETTLGTAVAATEIWRGTFGGFKDDRTRMVVEEDIGLAAASDRMVDTYYAGSLPVNDTPANVEQLCHLLEASIKAATPSGAGPYVRTYEYPVDGSANTLKPYTLRVGNSVVTADHRVIPGALMKEVKLGGKQGEAWLMGGSWMGTRVISGALTGSLSPITVEDMPFSKTLLYLDAGGGTIGSTQKTGVLLEAQIAIDPGVSYVPMGDGLLYPVAYVTGRPSVKFTLTYAFEQDGADSFVATERGMWENNTARLLRLSYTGSSASRKMVIDAAIRYDSVSEPKTFTDHVVGVTFEAHATYSAADSKYFSIEVTNSRATL